MSDQRAGNMLPEGERRGAGEPEEAAGPPWRRTLRAAAGFLVGHLATLAGALLLAIGAIFLINAWGNGPARRHQASALRSLTGRGLATVERAWWRLDFDPRPLGEDGTNWQDLSTPELCASIRFTGPAGEPVTAVYCRRWQKLSRGTTLTDGAEVAPGVAMVWSDPSGRPVIDLRFSERAFRWLSRRPPSFWFVLGPELSARAHRVARSELDVLWAVIDDPLSRLAQAWSARSAPVLPVAYDPARPARALPVGVLEEALRPDVTTTVFPFALGIGGLAFWVAGWVALLGRQRVLLVVVVAVVTAAAVPWWGDRVGRLIGYVWEPAGGFVEFFARELVHRPPDAVLRDVGYDGEVGDVRHPWSLETSFYAPLLGRLHLERPASGGDAPGIRRALAESVRTQVPEPDPEVDELLRGVEW
jgi:hypothetical protein